MLKFENIALALFYFFIVIGLFFRFIIKCATLGFVDISGEDRYGGLTALFGLIFMVIGLIGFFIYCFVGA